MAEELGKQSQTLQRFLRRVMRTGIDDGVPVTRIELVQGSRTIDVVKLGEFNSSSSPVVVEEIVSRLMSSAKDDALDALDPGAKCTFTVKAQFGASNEGGLSTRFSIYRPLEDGEDPMGDIAPNVQGAMAVGLKFVAGFSSDLMKATNQQSIRMMAQIDSLSEQLIEKDRQIRAFQQDAYDREVQKQKDLDNEANRKRLDAESERRDALNMEMLNTATVAFGALMPMMANGNKQLAAAPGVKAAVDYSIKAFARSITEDQMKAIVPMLDDKYPDADGDMDGPKRFLFLVSRYAEGQAPPPPQREGERFFDWLIGNSDRMFSILNLLTIPQKIFIQAHVKARQEELAQAAQ